MRFAGEEGSEKKRDTHIPKERLLYSLSPGKRALILFAEALMNLLVATIAFFLVFSFCRFWPPNNTDCRGSTRVSCLRHRNTCRGQGSTGRGIFL